MGGGSQGKKKEELLEKSIPRTARGNPFAFFSEKGVTATETDGAGG